ERPLLSLFFSGDDWIAWAPEGYYACSPGGEKLMGWHVNNGTDKRASYPPAAQLRKVRYRPDVIKKLLAAGDIKKALELADRERGKKTDSTELEDLLPPRVTVTSPRSGAAVRDRFEVEAEAVSRTRLPITALRLLVDGRTYEGELGRKFAVQKERSRRESWAVKLTPGKHRLSVVAETESSDGTSPEVEIVVGGEGPDRAELPILYVLSVGVAKYKDKDLALKYTARDATEVARVFESHSKGMYRK